MSKLYLLLCLISLLSINIEDINVEDTFAYNGYLLTYGDIGDGDKDGVLVVTDQETSEEVFNLVYDDNHNEYFKYVAVVNENEYIIVCEKYSYMTGYEMPDFMGTILIKIDRQGVIIDTHDLESRYIDYYNHGYMLILRTEDNTLNYLDSDFNEIENQNIDGEYTKSFFMQNRGEVLINDIYVENIGVNAPGNYQIVITENNFSFTYNIIVHPELFFIGEKYNEYFTGPVKIVTTSTVYINDELYIYGTYFDEPGIYEIKIYGEGDYIYSGSFMIIPVISYYTEDSRDQFVNELIVYEPISISSNAISMYLNDKIYYSELIEEVGDYELIIYGVNQMQFKLVFSIHPKVSGLENNKDYNQVSFNVFGEALLNGESVTDEVSIVEPGDYVLELMFKDEVFEKYYFSIVSEEDAVEESGFTFNYNYIFGIVIFVGVILFFRKK